MKKQTPLAPLWSHEGCLRLPFAAQRQPLKVSKKGRERLTRYITVVSWHFALSSCAKPALHCHLPKLRPSISFGEGRISPTLILPNIWLWWGRNLPTSPHRRLVNVPMVCVSSVGRKTHLLLLDSYASLGRLFFTHLKIFLRRNMLPSASPLCCNLSPMKPDYKAMRLPSIKPKPIIHGSTNI